MMSFARFRILLWLGILAAFAAPWIISPADAQTYNRFTPANGILKGSTSTYVTTAATSSDVISLWTGTCNTSTFLRGDGSCQIAVVAPAGANTQVQYNNAGVFGAEAALAYNSTTNTLTTDIFTANTGLIAPALNAPSALALSSTGANDVSISTNGSTRLSIGSGGDWLVGGTVGTNGQVLTSGGAGVPPAWTTVTGGGSGANPTATVGLTAVNGSAGTFIRSDGAPALSQAIAPTWTAKHIFSQSATLGSNIVGLSVDSAFPVLQLTETDQTAENQRWAVMADATALRIVALSSTGAISEVMAAGRSGASATSLSVSVPATYGLSSDTITRLTARGTGLNAQLAVQGNGTGASNVAYIGFVDSGGTRKGYIGDAGSGNSDIIINADTSGADINLTTIGTGQGRINGNGIVTVTGASQNATRIAFAGVSVAGGSTCSLQTQSGFSSCSRNSVGNYSLSSNSSMSNNSACTVSSGDTSVKHAVTNNLASSTAVNVIFYNDSHALADPGSFSVTCMSVN